MNPAFEIGAAALRAGQQALEIYANNVANVNTPGFKRTEARFSEVLARQVQPTDSGQAASASASMAGAGGGVRIMPQDTLFLQGELRTTGNPLDLAIEGQGLIELLGPGGSPLYWRGGALRINDDGLLATSNGYALRAAINVPTDAQSLSIARDGVVSVKTSGGETLEIGQIDLVRFDREDAMQRMDDGLFQATEGARIIDTKPGEDGAGTLAQASVEGSNVELTKEMVDMLMVQRAFAANAQILQAADQLAAITNNLKG